MSGRYLYKAKRTDNGEWVEGMPFEIESKSIFLIKDDENFLRVHYLEENMWSADIYAIEVDPSTICQCTGIPDKKGKRIFEKSIVRDEYGSLGIVEYGVFDYYNIGFYIRWLSESAEYYREELGYWANKVEVIGNVFDNPELMEVKE